MHTHTFTLPHIHAPHAHPCFYPPLIQVRTLVAHAGMEVRVLRRVRVGGYRLPRDMAFGEFKELRPHEVRRVVNAGADKMV